MTDWKTEVILRMGAKIASLLELKAQLPVDHTSHADIDDVVSRLTQHIGKVREVGDDSAR
jgi:hypothetical protein